MRGSASRPQGLGGWSSPNARLLWGGALVVLVAIAWPLFTGCIYTDSDLADFHLPMRVFYAHALARGEAFDWYPWSYAGFHLHGEGQAALYHPANWLLYRWLPLEVAFTLEVARSYLVTWIGSVLYLRHLGLRVDAALFGAFLFAFGSFSTSQFMHVNVTAIVAHVPFMAIAVDTLLRSDDRRRIAWATAGVSVLTASQLLFGHPQFAWLGLVAMGLLTLYRLANGVGLRRLPWLAAAVTAGFVLAGVQLLPQLESLRQSVRLSPDERFLNRFSLHPFSLLQLVSPDCFDLFARGPLPVVRHGVYLGAVVPGLWVWLALRSGALGPWRRAVIALAAVIALGYVMALGPEGGLHRLQGMLPIVGLFRAPFRYLMIVSLASACLGAIAFTDLARASERGARMPWRRAAWLALPALLSGAIFLWRLVGPLPDALQPIVSDVPRMAVGTACIVAASALLMAAARGVRIAIPALLLLTVVEVGARGVAWIRHEQPVTYEAHVSSLPNPDVAPGARIAFANQKVVLRGHRLVTGYAAMVPLRRLPIYDQNPFVKRSDLHPSVLPSLRVAAVEWPKRIVGDDPLERVRLVSKAVTETNLLLQMMQVDVDSTAIVAPAAAPAHPLALGGGPAGRAGVLEESPGRLVVATQAATRQLLVFAESYHSGWKARVDGDAADVVRVYGDFMGVVVGPGQRRVELEFDADSTRVGAWISGAGLVLTGLLAAGAARSSARFGVRAPESAPP